MHQFLPFGMSFAFADIILEQVFLSVWELDWNPDTSRVER